MKIAVLSDTHDHIWNLNKALQLIKEQKCECLIHCGDFCAPFTAAILSTAGLTVYACFGNNDEDQYAIAKRLKAAEFFSIGQEFGEIELDSKKIAFCHYPKLGELLAKTGGYSAVFHGHTHEAYQKQVSKTLLANPGSVCGIIGGKPSQASFGLYNTELNSFELINL
ncbi:MAG: phosphodiesterase [Microgenomates group bacterium Gr01-1014_16]|nr:MAG: phosphodiesterase [Microgenomates group bacterium Gr01-1014_16]